MSQNNHSPALHGGGFGRRLDVDYTVVAALTAKALAKPVKVIFSREQDFQFDMPAHRACRSCEAPSTRTAVFSSDP